MERFMYIRKQIIDILKSTSLHNVIKVNSPNNYTTSAAIYIILSWTFAL